MAYYRPSFFGGFSFIPPVIRTLLVTNGVVFLVMSFLGTFRLDGMPLEYALNTYFGLMPLGQGFWPWQLLTYQFMHADFWHLLFNMVFGLWMFGMEVEHIWGPRKFLFFYLMCGTVAGIAQLILSPIFDPGQAIGPTVGASGAVYGVLVAFAVMFPDRQVFIYFLIPVRVKYLVMFLIVFGVMSVGKPGNVANLAHLGGALAGYLYLQYDRRRLYRGRSRMWSDIGELFKMPRRETRLDDDPREAEVYDLHSERREPPTMDEVEQRKIDEILDKISQSGYQSLSEEEKKVLFEASKRIN